MTRELLLATAVLAAVAACASTDRSAPPPRATIGESHVMSQSPPADPGGITSPEAARVAPLAPPRLTAVPDAGGVRLAWPATGEDVAYYQCLRRTARGGAWQPVGQALPRQLSYLDRAPGGGSYVYGVRAVNARGHSSQVTESQPVTVP